MATTLTDLERAEKHKYRLPNGEIAVNVTTISGLLDDGKSGAFAGAAVKLTREGKNYREEWSTKADRGSRVHGHLEDWLHGKPTAVLDEDAGPVDALEKFFVDHQPKRIEVEPIVLCDRGYGGRLDTIVTIDGETALIDLKTGKKYVTEHTLQLSAYRFADGVAVYDDDGMLTGLRPLPPIDWAGCLYVHDDGTYDLIRYPADEAAFAIFCSLLEAWRWCRTPEIKELEKRTRA